MPMLFEIPAHRGKMLAISRAKRISLDAVYNRPEITSRQPFVASIALRGLCPGDQLIKILAMHHLAVATAIQELQGWHRSVICGTHQVLTQGIKTVLNVSRGYLAVSISPQVMNRFTDDFL